MSRWSSRVRGSDRPARSQVDEKDGERAVFGVNGWEIVLLALIAVFVLGPDRMPEYAAKLARGIRKLRVMAEGAKGQLKDQLGPEYEDINWRQYDPRQYDPRRIVSEALARAARRRDLPGARRDRLGARGGRAQGRGGRRRGAPRGPRVSGGHRRRRHRAVAEATPAVARSVPRRWDPAAPDALRRRRHLRRHGAPGVSDRRA